MRRKAAEAQVEPPTPRSNSSTAMPMRDVTKTGYVKALKCFTIWQQKDVWPQHTTSGHAQPLGPSVPPCTLRHITICHMSGVACSVMCVGSKTKNHSNAGQYCPTPDMTTKNPIDR